jgi:uncharacterized protein (UPF0335 family)
MSSFDEDPSENRGELEMCIDEIKELQIENKKLKKEIKEAYNTGYRDGVDECCPDVGM